VAETAISVTALCSAVLDAAKADFSAFDKASGFLNACRPAQATGSAPKRRLVLPRPSSAVESTGEDRLAAQADRVTRTRRTTRNAVTTAHQTGSAPELAEWNLEWAMAA